MKNVQVIKALEAGSTPYTRLYIGNREDNWVYIKIDVADLLRELKGYSLNKVIPCTLSPYKSSLWFDRES